MSMVGKIQPGFFPQLFGPQQSLPIDRELEEFSIRPDSGGRSQHPGGNSIIRHLRFLKPITAAKDIAKFNPVACGGAKPGH